ncbi:hypothetical protein Taro_055546 [Colocasia esculenta]|uniref:Uncharacterized protein n=1 Tax=Colocasia esculenta TaxID=4460 RepID=A0A843XTR3_COLES|nr:hypothetical protein [Colocasia esculenta]
MSVQTPFWNLQHKKKMKVSGVNAGVATAAALVLVATVARSRNEQRRYHPVAGGSYYTSVGSIATIRSSPADTKRSGYSPPSTARSTPVTPRSSSTSSARNSTTMGR